MRKALDYFRTNQTDIAEEITWQMGRPISQTPGEINGLIERANHMIDIAPEALQAAHPESKSGFNRFIQREPLGTVAALAPWNYPYLTSVNAVVPALLAGNTVILKHSEQTPLCAERYAAAFSEAGLPDGVFQYLFLNHGQAATLIADQRINYVAFTGSVEGGHAVVKALSGKFSGCGLELGGKDPAYVREDADLSQAVENLVDGSFFNSGQSCCGIERIYVHQSLYAEFVDRFVELASQYKLGNPTLNETNLGPMVRARAADFVRGQISDGIKNGAKSLIAPDLFPAAEDQSPYLAPQVLVNVNHDMRVMREESFGPVVGIQAVDSDEQAISLMNDSDYGLTASVWTQDQEAALAIGQQIETGTFFMNRCDYLDPALAWTGIKDSGRGCTLSSLGYESLTRPKSFHLKTA